MQTLSYLTAKKNTHKLMQVALGEQQADLAVINARLANVYTGELLENQAIAICGHWIAYVGENPGQSIGPDTVVIDAAGKTVIPGLIDGHTHLAWGATVAEYLRYIIRGGTTTIVTEALEPYPIAGLHGLADFADSLKGQPIKCLCTAPAVVSISHEARKIPAADLKTFLDRGDVLGLGETYWQTLLQEPALMLPRFKATTAAGKLLEGHSAGASEKKLNAYIAAGITSCHEPIKAPEVLERLRLGIHVMVREGSIRRDLKEISKIRLTEAELRRLILVTDGVQPQDLMEKGYMEYLVQKAIDCGFKPITAIQMATLNVAEHFSLDAVIGGIAPGRFADMLVIPDVDTIKAETVISNGVVVAQNNETLVPPRRHQWSHDSRHTVNLPKKLKARDFRITDNTAGPVARVRVIEQITELVTAETEATLPVGDGEICMDVDQDIIKVAAIDRTHRPGKTFTGFLKGFGLKAGAFACSAAWDSSDIIVAGTNESDMAAAVNRLHELQGGAVLVEESVVAAELAMPIFGLASDLPIEKIAHRFEAIQAALAARGVSFPDATLSLITLTGAAIPFLRICEEGLVSLKNGKTVDLVIE